MIRRTRTLLLGIAAVAIALLLLARSRETPPPEREATTPVRAIAQPPTAPPATVDPPVPFVTGRGPHRIESGQTIGIESDALPSEALLLELRLPVDAVGATPPVRVIAPDGRLIETLGEPGAEPGSVSLPLDPAWLRPGRYIIEVKTLERSHFPLRRYALEVR